MRSPTASVSAKAEGGGRWAGFFLDHPASLGESYWEHQGHALHFGIALLGAALACIVHALVPALFQRTGSTTVERLHSEMTARRRIGAAGHRSADALPGEPLVS
jgi:hypothetical protein